MFGSRVSPQFTTSTPVAMSSAANSKVPTPPALNSAVERDKKLATFTLEDVINFLDANNLGSFVPKFVEAEFDGPLFASLCHPHFGSSILQDMGIGKEDGELIVNAIKREMMQ